jgi:hypothetical protein
MAIIWFNVDMSIHLMVKQLGTLRARQFAGIFLTPATYKGAKGRIFQFELNVLVSGAKSNWHKTGDLEMDLLPLSFI